MLIKVLRTTKAATDKSGCYSKDYLKDNIYDMYDELADIFIKNGWGTKVKDKKKKNFTEVDNKAFKEVLENKTFKNKKSKKKNKFKE